MKGKPITPPVVFSATYSFERSDDLIDVVRNRTGYIYSRWDNPTVREVENALAKMEGYTDAVAFSSGMAAITSTLFGLLGPREKLVSIATYGETVRFISDFLPKMGVEVERFGPDEIDRCIESLQDAARVLYLESPMNPLLRVVDIKPLAEHAHRHGVIVVLDSTFASPVNQHPLDLGVDIVIHSATKYLGGHHDLLGGFACMNEENRVPIWNMRRTLGGVMDPMSAYLVWRGMKTLGVRVARQNETAMSVAKFLEGHSKVVRVYYPGLPSHPDHEIAARQMRGFGGMVSFEIASDYEETKTFMDSLQAITLATSLGGVDTLATQPVTNTHASMSAQERKAAGIPDNLVRLSVGLEDAGLIIADLEAAFAKL